MEKSEHWAEQNTEINPKANSNLSQIYMSIPKTQIQMQNDQDDLSNQSVKTELFNKQIWDNWLAICGEGAKLVSLFLIQHTHN